MAEACCCCIQAPLILTNRKRKANYTVNNHADFTVNEPFILTLKVAR